MLSGDDWRDIKEIEAIQAEQSGASEESIWSPRAELSGERLLASSDEDMESPEGVVKQMLVYANIDEVDWTSNTRRRSGSSSSQSLIFSPILIKPGGDVINVSTSSSAMNVSERSVSMEADRSSNRATVGTTTSSNESAATLPLGPGNQQGASGNQMQTAMAMWRMGWGSAACSTQFLSWAQGEYHQAFVDDLARARNGDMAVVKEEETEEIEDDVFDMSQIE